MRKKITLYIAVMMVGVLSITAVVMAQSSSNFDLTWRTLSEGGDQHRSANFILEESVGQMVAGDFKSPKNAVVAGFVQSFVVADSEEEEGMAPLSSLI